MKVVSIRKVFQEIPNEISISFFISGCKIHCKGCHSSEFWGDVGTTLTVDYFNSVLSKYQGLASCVLFLGGEWTDELPLFLDLAREQGYKTALYTGDTDVSHELKDRLNYLKTGEWRGDLGGLDSADTNQVLMNLDTGEVMNHYFLEHKK